MNQWNPLIDEEWTHPASSQGAQRIISFRLESDVLLLRFRVEFTIIAYSDDNADSSFILYANHPDIQAAQKQMLKNEFSAVLHKIKKNSPSVLFFDPKKNFRGRWDASFSDWKTISAKKASDGFAAGPVAAGEWKAQILVPALGGASLRAHLQVESSAEDEESSVSAMVYQWPDHEPQAGDERWYIGELHEHTSNSNGALSPEATADLYKSLDYQFLALTDHDFRPLATFGKTPPLELIRGQEIRTFFGHALLLGIKDYLRWRSENEPFDLDVLIYETHRLGGLFCALHPFAMSADGKSDSWQGAEASWSRIDLLEIWPGRWRQRFPEILKALDLWDSLLNRGLRIYGVCGKGSGVPMNERSVETLPKTAVFSEGPNETELLGALKQGRFYSTREPGVSFWAYSNHGGAMMGDELRLPAGEPYQLVLDVSLMEKRGFVRIKSNEGIYCEMPLSSTKDSHLEFIEFSKTEVRWFRAEVYQYGRPLDELAALTNPIFVRGVMSA
ncbi:MAG: CehA/McbA family metallohydrolase [Candidatus Omnitrophota bacterium]